MVKSRWKEDYSSYIYELATSLLCRILVLSVPNPEAAKMIGIAAAFTEVCTRVFFYVAFIRSGMDAHTWNAQQRENFAGRGIIRVMDSNNDMKVEYVSSIAAACILYYLPQTGAFQFARVIGENGGENMEGAVLLSVLSYQLVPEFFCD